MAQSLSADQHAERMSDYITAGTERAYALGNRGPIRRDANGEVAADILEAFWEHGFYIFENVVDQKELAELRADVDGVLAGAPIEPGSEVDRQGRPAFGRQFTRPVFNLVKPLSDPLGGTSRNKGRHPVKMQGPAPAAGAPEWTVANLTGNLQLMDACLRLYGHPDLLSVASAVLGPDFVPYNEVAFVKEPGLGPSVAWHQDGTTHWDAQDWDRQAHGFNFMVQLYPSTPGNAVWVLPGSHARNRGDIKKMVADSGSEQIEGAVPLLCHGGDTCMVNRQLVHGSFANSSTERRITLNEGFFPRSRIENVTTTQLNEQEETYVHERIDERSRVVQLAIDARSQHRPEEAPFAYAPFVGREDENRWNEENRERILKDYNLRDMYI